VNYTETPIKCKECNILKPPTEFPWTRRGMGAELRLNSYTCRECQSKHTHIRKKLTKENPKPANGICKSCGQKSPKLVCDHNHKTNRFRGWICHNCNTGMGKFGDNSEGVGRAYNYLLKVEREEEEEIKAETENHPFKEWISTNNTIESKSSNKTEIIMETLTQTTTNLKSLNLIESLLNSDRLDLAIKAESLERLQRGVSPLTQIVTAEIDFSKYDNIETNSKRHTLMRNDFIKEYDPNNPNLIRVSKWLNIQNPESVVNRGYKFWKDMVLNGCFYRNSIGSKTDFLVDITKVPTDVKINNK